MLWVVSSFQVSKACENFSEQRAWWKCRPTPFTGCEMASLAFFTTDTRAPPRVEDLCLVFSSLRPSTQSLQHLRELADLINLVLLSFCRALGVANWSYSVCTVCHHTSHHHEWGQACRSPPSSQSKLLGVYVTSCGRTYAPPSPIHNFSSL